MYYKKMYLHSNNVILLTICLIFSPVHTQPKKDIEDNISDKTQLPADLQSKEDAGKHLSIISFLTNPADLSILNIPFNKKSIDILKADTNISMVHNKKLEHTKEIDIEKSKNAAASIAPAVAHITGDEDETVKKVISNQNLLSNHTSLSVFNIIYNNNNENALTILKSSSKSMVDNKNTTKEDERNNEKIEVKSDRNFNSSNKIVLSELINLSLNDAEDSSIGQKIKVESSNMIPDTDDNNSVGAEILKNISETCGSLFGKRISFANETTLMEFPWTALLLYNTKIRYHCGGSLITKKYVLTAAHCVAQQFYELIGVRLGEHDISEPIDCAPDIVGDTICATTIDVDVVKIIVHHEYSHLSFKNDIALLRLDKDYIDRSYYPICLPTPEMMYDDQIATVAGWGATEKAVRSAILLKADVPIYDISKCREIYSYSVFNDTTEICASGGNEVDVCKGDSGGALFYNIHVKGRDKFYQLGIISMGVRRCGDSRFLPAVFTKVKGFYKWIENNLEY